MEPQEIVIIQTQYDTLILKLTELVQGINDINNTLPDILGEILTYLKVAIVVAGIVLSFILAVKLINTYVMGWVRYLFNKVRF